MNITKYHHACFTAEVDDALIVVDPGDFSDDFIAPDHVVAIVITHEHADHFDHEYVADIIDKNPEAIIIGHEAVTKNIEVFQTQSVTPGDMITIGPFNLEFFGGEHNLIHKSVPVVTNLGVMINDLLFYPGDSFVNPNRPIDTLALPVAAPWLKINEAMDYLTAIKPRLAFPTHDAILSDAGKEVADAWIMRAAKSSDIEYKRLETQLEI